MNLTNLIVIDTETTGLNTWLGHEAFCVGMYDGKDYFYWEWLVNPRTRKVQYKYDEEFFELQEILYGENNYQFGFWNAKHDIRFLEKMFVGRKIEKPIHEIMYMCKACNTMEPSYKLKKIAEKYLDIPVTDESNLKKQVQQYRKIANKKGYAIGDVLEMDYWLPNAMGSSQNLVKKYNLLDCKRTWFAAEYFSEGMKELNVEHTYKKEMRLFPVVYNMEKRGVRIDHTKLKQEQEQLLLLEKETEKKTRELFDVNLAFNFDSPKQLVDLLFGKLSLPVQKETKKGNVSTDVTTLKKLQDLHPGVKSLLLLRGVGKGLDYLKDYDKYGIVDHLISNKAKDGEWIDKYNYRAIHASFNPWGASTGRFSCNSPNLQNVSSEETSSGENVVDARHFFIPREGYYWFCIDYKQLELRIFASRANEVKMLEAFISGRDIHDEVRQSVKRLANLPEKRGRKIAKNINFTKVNGGGAKVLWEKYEVPLAEGKTFLKDYDNTYPDTKTHIDNMTRLGHNQGYIYNAYNRKLMLEKGFEYRASPYDIQSSAADVMKGAMINCSSFLEKKGVDCHIVMSIHDELVFECNKKCATKTLMKEIKDIMEDHQGVFSIPLPVDISLVTDNWRKKQDLKL